MFDKIVLPSGLEAAAVILTVLSVFLAVKRSIWQYPVGLVAVVLFGKVVYDAGLYSSAALQVFFFGVQFYGWWYWLRGDNGGRPRITNASSTMLLTLTGLALAFGLLTSFVTQSLGAAVAFWDAQILSFSLAAQFLLDRKKIETWFAWALVNIVSIPVYYGQDLHFLALLYVGLLINTAVGFYFWLGEQKGYVEPDETVSSANARTSGGFVEVWEKGTTV